MAEQTELDLSPARSSENRRPRRRPVFAGLHRAQMLAGLFVLGALVWGMWVTRELVKPRQDRIVAARLSSIVGDYVQAQARSSSPPTQVEAEMRKFMASLDFELAQRAKQGEVVLVGEAVLTKNVPDITDALREAVYASGLARPREASAAEWQRLQDPSMTAAGPMAAAPQVARPMPYPESVAPSDGDVTRGGPEAQDGPPAPSVSSFERSGPYAGQ